MKTWSSVSQHGWEVYVYVMYIPKYMYILLCIICMHGYMCACDNFYILGLSTGSCTLFRPLPLDNRRTGHPIMELAYIIIMVCIPFQVATNILFN